MRFITDEALRSWLDRLAGQVVLSAPRLVDGIVLYRPVSGSDEIVYEYTRPKLSAKEMVLPPAETTLFIEQHGRELTLAEPEVRPQVVFGVRPCDAHGIAVLDTVFVGKEPVDTNYARRRAATTLIGMACPAKWSGCFCDRMGGAPDDPTHLDILLTAADGGYEVQVVTAKGEQLFVGLALENVQGNRSPLPHKRDVRSEPEQWRQVFTDSYWDRLAERCIGCRLCAYLCPTCRCFDVRDQLEARDDAGEHYERLRCWDSCTRANYRTIAGGHNPRPTKGQRLRNRFFCKFHYLPLDYGEAGCVGCGRCVESCPVNIDALQVLDEIPIAKP